MLALITKVKITNNKMIKINIEKKKEGNMTKNYNLKRK